ncbi:MAG: helix-turn-helix transcriptional regulator, partial [Hominilimicola sp.]
KLTPILSYITQNYNSISGIEEVASRFYITKYHLCRLFKQHTGLTITHYITQIRLQHACELLTDTNKSVTAIAMECGFNSSMYFCKTFKKNIGMTPSEFRANSD